MTLDAEQRRALQLLAGNPRGSTEGLMLMAHGFENAMLTGLIRDGLMSTKSERVHAGREPAVEMVRLRITDAGRRALGTST